MTGRGKCTEPSRTLFQKPMKSRKVHFFPKDTLLLISYNLIVDHLWLNSSLQHPSLPKKPLAVSVFGRRLYTTLKPHLLHSLSSSILGNPSRWIKRRGECMRSHCKAEEGRMLTGAGCCKTQSHIFPKSSTRYSALLLNSLKRGKTFSAFQCKRSLNNQALLNKQTEESPVKLFIKPDLSTKGRLLLNNPPPMRINIYLRPQIKHITTSQQKYVSQWDLSKVQLNKSLEMSRASLKGEHSSTVKHSHWKSHSQKVI